MTSPTKRVRGIYEKVKLLHKPFFKNWWQEREREGVQKSQKMGDVIYGQLHSESICYFFESAKTHTNFSSRTTQQLSQYTQKIQLLIFLAVFLLLINLTQAEMIKMKRHTSFCCSSTQLLWVCPDRNKMSKRNRPHIYKV